MMRKWGKQRSSEAEDKFEYKEKEIKTAGKDTKRETQRKEYTAKILKKNTKKEGWSMKEKDNTIRQREKEQKKDKLSQ